jgi:hypothetical protein
MEFQLGARTFVRVLAGIAAALLALHLAETILFHVFGHRRLMGLVGTFNMNFENNIPTFFSAFLLLAGSMLNLLASRRPGVTPQDARYWRWLALIFLLLALDEDAALHELWIEPLHALFPLGGPLYFAWVIPYGIGLVVIALLYLRFVLRLPAPTGQLVLLAGTLYVTGAFGLELVGGWYLSRHDESVDYTYSLLIAVEESLEMCGSILLIHALLDYIRSGLVDAPVRLRIR